MDYFILSINPGSTSTKVALYQNERPIFSENMVHSPQQLAPFDKLIDQFAFRRDRILELLRQRKVDLHTLSAVVGRGGMLPPIAGGGYEVNEDMEAELRGDRIPQHASNLGGLIAADLARPLGIPAYIYDAVSTDELTEVAKVTGIPEIRRRSFCHVLNAKATARKVAAALGSTYEAMNFLVAHLGGGISVSAHEGGRIIDVITDDAGPFSPERAGSVPLGYVLDLCYSGKYTVKELIAKLNRNSGIKGLLGTNDCREVEQRIAHGDQQAELVYRAQAYQIAKGIGELAPVLCGRVDRVILTGGLAHSEMLMGMIRARVDFIAPVVVVPGENELEALALGALRILRGEETPSVYHRPTR